ncbi:MAG: hypothetical protein K9M11_03655 [Candidatus Pacebacteria bacterium]|nr:hypothetical protein [Candidatus Paceibacterota bacterium]
MYPNSQTPQKNSLLAPEESKINLKKDILPHKKVLILGAVCISIIVILLTYKISNERRLLLEKQSDLLVTAGRTEEEIVADRKIVEALKEAKLTSLGSLANSTNPFDPSPKDNISDRFTKDVFAAYLQYNKDGVLPDGDSLIQNFDYLDINDTDKNKYSLSFMNIFVPTTKDEIRNYGNIFAKTYLDTIAPVDRDVLKYQTDINAMVPIYKAIGENLLKVRVPSVVASFQLELVNQYLKQADAFVLVGGQVKDPVKALLGLKVIREGIPVQVEMFTNIKKYLNENGIVYTENEPGNFWNVGTTTISIQQQ